MARFPYTLTEHAKRRISDRSIQLEWVTKTLTSPEKVEVDSEDSSKSHAFRVIPESGGNVLHIVYNGNVNPWIIISAYFDRKYKGKI